MGLLSSIDVDNMIYTIGGGSQITLFTNIGFVSVYAIVNTGHRSVFLGDGEVATLAPSVTVATADIENDICPGEVSKAGTTVDIAGVTYRVIEHRKDGQGFSDLILARDE